MPATYAPIGILMLDTSFERLVGDAGNPGSWPFPVVIRKVKGADVSAVIDRGAKGLGPLFIEEGRKLVKEDGCVALTTTCGFLAIVQKELAAAVSVPVATSSLMQVAIIDRLLPPGKRSGILTFDANGLSREILEAAGAPADTPVAGLPRDGRFQEKVRTSTPVPLDILERETIAMAQAFAAKHPEVGALVVECANLPTFSAAIARQTRLPVYDLITMIEWLRAGVMPRSYAQ
jgi:Asp/Glu/hydantoin racemase